MSNKLSSVFDALNVYSIGNIAINNDEKKVDVEFFDEEKKKHHVVFLDGNTYFYLDENMIKDEDAIGQSIRSLDEIGSEIITVDSLDDGSVVEQTVASPNILLNTESASIILEAESMMVDGESYQLFETLN